MLGGAKNVGGCTNEVGGVHTPPENPPVFSVSGKVFLVHLYL